MLQRILVAVVGVPALLFVLCWCPAWATMLLLMGLCTIGAYELLNAVLGREKAKRWWGFAAVLAIVVLGCTYGSQSAALAWMPWVLLVFVALLFAVMILEHGKEKGLRFLDICTIAVAGIVIPLALGCLLRLRMLAYGAGLVLIPLVAAFSSDTMAFFTGLAIGKHKLIPSVSPKKTVEGAVGGLLGGMVGMVLYRIVFFLITEVQLHILFCLLIGLLGAVAGQMGDLVFSCVKREYGIKDYGKLLPGHGGVLDRFDSVTLAAPLVWAILSRVALY